MDYRKSPQHYIDRYRYRYRLDYLLIFGEASQEEIATIHHTLTMFCDMSGQQIGSEKSRIWFSKATPAHLRQLAISVFNAQPARGSEVYLGSPITLGKSTDFSPLVDKIDGKLQHWASSMLSQAGKLTLIKAVIEPTMLFAMQTASIPSTTLKLIQSKVRKFFWGKGNERRMPLVSWKSITVPKQQGGLGLKDLLKFQQTLSMKCLWAIASEENSLWVQVVKAKYLQRNTIWSATRTTRCTPLWRAIVAAKPLLRDNVTWLIGNGKTCRAMGQPWHDLWLQYEPTNAAQRKVVVADLVQEQGRGWDCQKLIQLLGFHGALYLAIVLPEGPSLSHREDRLIFKAQNNGQFSIKAAYRFLVQRDNHMHNTPLFPEELYRLIWKTNYVLPRARVFLWRAIREALPVDQVISSRLSKPPKGCPLCGETDETGVHVLFKCANAQPIWRISQFDLTTTGLPDTMGQLLSYLAREIGEQNWPIMVSVLWSWWKDRCKTVYEGTRTNPTRTLGAANYWLTTLQKSNLCNKVARGAAQAQQQNQGLLQTISCWVDASWVHTSSGGCGKAYVLYNEDGSLMQYQMMVGEASSPYHAELLSLKEAVRTVHAMGISRCDFYTDCMLLHDILSGSSSPEAVDWWTYGDTLEWILEWNRHKHFKCLHVNRDQNQLADKLSKFARTRGISTVDFTFPTICVPLM
ncbi:hypothetical protein LUZ63_005598 [Rhynchospora breviuscula]|uniref:Uncharacterized protein n=1 Tax=Rhynchospora breviuscula TaxID=2022672 RepID=A0A9Q0CN79_9POAL|nr:hypothetical protein LUZ63_005598 [Rhynchospora breviuscula]